MGRTFPSDRIGRPQFLAGILLAVFMGECLWLILHESPVFISQEESARLEEGVAQWNGSHIAGTYAAGNGHSLADEAADGFDRDHSSLWYLIGSLPAAWLKLPPGSLVWLLGARVPYVLIGALLGASVWYVSRRLYGNAGGYIALALYCSSPALIRASALWFTPPNITAAWGSFGAVFTGIAVAHTLYAPREVVLWNWRRIMLLGVSLALAMGSEFSLAIVVPVILLFMFYLAPERKGAALAILSSAGVLALGLLFAAYFFNTGVFLWSLRQARWISASLRPVGMPGAYRMVFKELAGSGPVVVVLAPAAAAVYLGWRRSRYFGTTAPLVMWLLFSVLRVLSPHRSDAFLSLTAAVFLFVFIAGIAADLLETGPRELVRAVLVGLLSANGVWNLMALGRIRGS